MNWILTFLREFALRIKAQSPVWFVRLRYISIFLAGGIGALVAAMPAETLNIVIIPVVHWTLGSVSDSIALLLTGMWATSFTAVENRGRDINTRL